MTRIASIVVFALLPMPGLSQAAPAVPAGLERDFDVAVASGAIERFAAVSDGAGGVIVLWNSPGSISAQRIDSSGRPQWGQAGVPVAAILSRRADLSDPVEEISAVADGTGGAVIIWSATSSAGARLFAQRVSDAGRALWGASGVALSAASLESQRFHEIVADHEGGAIVAWRSEGAGMARVVAQRLDSQGSELWGPDGVLVSHPFVSDSIPIAGPSLGIIDDGTGGAIIAWRDGGAAGVRIQRLDAGGRIVWSPGGESVGGSSALSPRGLAMIDDGEEGAVLAWIESDGGDDGFVTLHRVDGSGNEVWGATGARIAADAPVPSSLLLASDGAGGDLVAWARDGARGGGVFAQRVGADGEIAWPARSVAVSSSAGTQALVAAFGDSSGSVTIFWQGGVGSKPGFLAQRLAAGGDVLWEADGESIESGAGGSLTAMVLSEGRGGWILARLEQRGDSPRSLTALRIVVPSLHATHDVTVGNFFFSPENLDITVGDTVQWKWTGGSHSSTSGSCPGGECAPDGTWDSDTRTSGSFSFVFDSTGTFPYFCKVHGAMMQGTINVAPAGPLTCNATAAPASGEVELTVRFDANASGGTLPLGFQWSFDDGAFSTDASPSHVFTAPGTYSVNVTVTDSASSAEECFSAVEVTTDPCAPRTISSVIVKEKSATSVSVKVIGSGFRKGDLVQIGNGSTFQDAPVTKFKSSTKIVGKQLGDLFPNSSTVFVRVRKANNCASSALPASR